MLVTTKIWFKDIGNGIVLGQLPEFGFATVRDLDQILPASGQKMPTRTTTRMITLDIEKIVPAKNPDFLDCILAKNEDGAYYGVEINSNIQVVPLPKNIPATQKEIKKLPGFDLVNRQVAARTRRPTKGSVTDTEGLPSA